MFRAVLDANVIISALIQPKGPSGRILTSLLQRNSFELVVSSTILAEVRRSLSYPKVRKYIEAAVEGLAQFVVTGDKHLLSLKFYESIRIVTPRVFVDLL